MRPSQLPDWRCLCDSYTRRAHRNPMPIRLLPCCRPLGARCSSPRARGRGLRARSGDRGLRGGRRRRGRGDVAADAGAAPVAGAAGRLRAARRSRTATRSARRSPSSRPGPERRLRGAELASAHAAATRAERPRTGELQWNLFGTYGHQPGRGLDAAAALGAPGRPRRGRGRARQRRGLREARALPAGARPAPLDVRAAVGLHRRDRHPNDATATAPTWRARSPRRPTTASATAGIAYNAKIMPLRVLDSLRRGRLGRDRARDPLRGPPPRRRDQPVARVPRRGARRRDPRRGQRAPLREPARRRSSWRRPATRTDITVAYPARVSTVIAVGATTITGCQADYSNSRRRPRRRGAGRRRGRAQHRQRLGRRALQPGLRAGRSSSRPSRSSVQRFGLPRIYEGTSMAAPHVAAIAALLIATKRLGPHPTPERGRGAHQGHRAAHGPARTATAPGSWTRPPRCALRVDPPGRPRSSG